MNLSFLTSKRNLLPNLDPIFGYDIMPNKRSSHSNVYVHNNGNARGKDNGRGNRNSSEDNTSLTLTFTVKFLSRLVYSNIIFTVKRSLYPTYRIQTVRCFDKYTKPLFPKMNLILE